MKIGEYVSIESIMNQSMYKWVVLVDLQIDDEGVEVLGGTIKFIGNTKSETGKKAETLYDMGVDAMVIPGLPDEKVILSGVLVQ